MLRKQKITDQQVLEASVPGLSAGQIAANLGIHRESYKRRAKALGCYVKLPDCQVGLPYTLELIRTGDYKQFDEVVIRKHVKRFLIHKGGHICNICNTSTWRDKPIPLICDHIDGDSTNNEISNFRLVCPNCDAQLPTFKSKNRGKGRKYDRQRYAKRTT